MIVKTLEEKPKNATHWSTRSMAAATGMSQSTVSRIWRAFALAPHRSQTFKLSTDPLFIEVIGSLHRRHRAAEFKKFLAKIDKEVPADLQVHLILDNYATHKTPDVKKWLLAHPRFQLHFTPTSASWLNLVERWFAELTQKKLKNAASTAPSSHSNATSGPGWPTGTSSRGLRLDEDSRRNPRQSRRLRPTNL